MKREVVYVPGHDKQFDQVREEDALYNRSLRIYKMDNEYAFRQILL